MLQFFNRNYVQLFLKRKFTVESNELLYTCGQLEEISYAIIFSELDLTPVLGKLPMPQGGMNYQYWTIENRAGGRAICLLPASIGQPKYYLIGEDHPDVNNIEMLAERNSHSIFTIK